MHGCIKQRGVLYLERLACFYNQIYTNVILALTYQLYTWTRNQLFLGGSEISVIFSTAPRISPAIQALPPPFYALLMDIIVHDRNSGIIIIIIIIIYIYIIIIIQTYTHTLYNYCDISL